MTEADAQQRYVVSLSQIGPILILNCLNRGVKTVLTEEDERRLTSALKKNSMKGLTKIEHAHLSVLVKTVYEVIFFLFSTNTMMTKALFVIDSTTTRIPRFQWTLLLSLNEIFLHLPYFFCIDASQF